MAKNDPGLMCKPFMEGGEVRIPNDDSWFSSGMRPCGG
jgi:hypothetical protein